MWPQPRFQRRLWSRERCHCRPRTRCCQPSVNPLDLRLPRLPRMGLSVLKPRSLRIRNNREATVKRMSSTKVWMKRMMKRRHSIAGSVGCTFLLGRRCTRPSLLLSLRRQHRRNARKSVFRPLLNHSQRTPWLPLAQAHDPLLALLHGLLAVWLVLLRNPFPLVSVAIAPATASRPRERA